MGKANSCQLTSYGLTCCPNYLVLHNYETVSLHTKILVTHMPINLGRGFSLVSHRGNFVSWLGLNPTICGWLIYKKSFIRFQKLRQVTLDKRYFYLFMLFLLLSPTLYQLPDHLLNLYKPLFTSICLHKIFHSWSEF